MIDYYILEHLQVLLHGPLNVFDKEGKLLQSFEQGVSQPVAPREFLGKGIEEPYIFVEEDGVAFAVITDPANEYYIVMGRIRLFFEMDDMQQMGISYCGKKEFQAVIRLAWRALTGEELESGDYWHKLVEPVRVNAKRFNVYMDNYRQSGKNNVPYLREMRELDSIRRGDIMALEETIKESDVNEFEHIDESDIRKNKNHAVYLVGNAARSAVQGGVNPERAFTMADFFLENIENNLTSQKEIIMAVKEAKYVFAREVKDSMELAPGDALIQKVKDYIFRNVQTRIRVDAIASEVGVTPNYLSDYFRKKEKISLKQYILGEKILLSEYLLKYSELSIGEISEKCAFSSPGRFSEYFTRKNGISPIKYRKMYQ